MNDEMQVGEALPPGETREAVDQLVDDDGEPIDVTVTVIPAGVGVHASAETRRAFR